MAEFIGSIWWFIVALGVLVSFHEFGHFWVARRLGVKVLRFSVGFGKPLWSRYGKDGTEYAVAAIPLGGYVKMLDEREGEVAPGDLDGAFNRKPLGVRAAIVAAGPIFNLIFTVFAFWLMFMIGIPEIRAVVGQPTGIAEQAGIRDGDRIVSVAGEPTGTMTQANIELLAYALDREPVEITVEGAGGDQRRLTIPMHRLGPDFREERMFEALGLQLWQPRIDAVLGEVLPGQPAAEAGFRAGDKVLAINDRPVESWADLGQTIQELAPAGEPLDFKVERDGVILDLRALPGREAADAPYMIGVAPVESVRRAAGERLFTVLRHGPGEALIQSLDETRRMTSATLGLLRRMVTGDASLRNLSGPIAIAQYANDHAQMGVSRFLFFLAVLSLSLAILNFLPVPLLDGGHLLYYFIEWIKGSPVSERSQLIGQYIGLTALAALVSLTFYNDILRLLS